MLTKLSLTGPLTLTTDPIITERLVLFIIYYFLLYRRYVLILLAGTYLHTICAYLNLKLTNSLARMAYVLKVW